jgi:hypothetical protein
MRKHNDFVRNYILLPRRARPLVLFFECVRKKVIGKPCEGEPHARFDEGAVDKSTALLYVCPG